MNLIGTRPTILPSVTGVGLGSTLPMRSGRKKMGINLSCDRCGCSINGENELVWCVALSDGISRTVTTKYFCDSCADVYDINLLFIREKDES